VLNTGSPVEMPWIDDVAGVLQVWFGGQEFGDALVDVLLGDADPGGRLPTTFPRRYEDNPTLFNYPGENGEVFYGEGVFVGYRAYDTQEVEPLFPFGHGLSYADLALGEPEPSATTWSAGQSLTVRVPVTNSSDRDGVEVVQAYVAAPTDVRFRPDRELRAFAKVAVAAGATEEVELTFDDRSFAAWDPEAHDWVVDPGRYQVHIGRSSADLPHVVPVDIA